MRVSGRDRRRRGLTVALLGLDGAGKTTLAHALAETSFPVPVRRVYMGLYGRGDPGARELGPVGRLLAAWVRYARSRAQVRRGEIVVFDRYTYDAALAPDGEAGLARRAYRSLLAHACPEPDLVVILDLPAEVARERKGEHSLARLRADRSRYLALGSSLSGSIVVDASRPAAEVRREVEELVLEACAGRRGRA